MLQSDEAREQWRIAKIRARKFLELKRFDPSQPRDERGRWEDAGGGDDAALGIPNDKVNPSTESVAKASVKEWFPNADMDKIEVVGNVTSDYNCAALALGDDKKIWWPVKYGGNYWPKGLPRSGDVPREDYSSNEDIQNFDKLLIDKAGGEATKDESVEAGYVKIALYGTPHDVKHLARQVGPDRWASKLGRSHTIKHGLRDIEDAEGHMSWYGTVLKIYRLKTEAWRKLRKM